MIGVGAVHHEAQRSWVWSTRVWRFWVRRIWVRRTWTRRARGQEDQAAGIHVNSGLLKGTHEDYSWLGENWPDSRYLLITLSGEGGVKRTIRGWRCRYDLELGKFDVPAVFARDNAEAIAPE